MFQPMKQALSIDELLAKHCTTNNLHSKPVLPTSFERQPIPNYVRPRRNLGLDWSPGVTRTPGNGSELHLSDCEEESVTRTPEKGAELHPYPKSVTRTPEILPDLHPRDEKSVAYLKQCSSRNEPKSEGYKLHFSDVTTDQLDLGDVSQGSAAHGQHSIASPSGLEQVSKQGSSVGLASSQDVLLTPNELLAYNDLLSQLDPLSREFMSCIKILHPKMREDLLDQIHQTIRVKVWEGQASSGFSAVAAYVYVNAPSHPQAHQWQWQSHTMLASMNPDPVAWLKEANRDKGFTNRHHRKALQTRAKEIAADSSGRVMLSGLRKVNTKIITKTSPLQFHKQAIWPITGIIIDWGDGSKFPICEVHWVNWVYRFNLLPVVNGPTKGPSASKQRTLMYDGEWRRNISNLPLRYF